MYSTRDPRRNGLAALAIVRYARTCLRAHIFNTPCHVRRACHAMTLHDTGGHVSMNTVRDTTPQTDRQYVNARSQRTLFAFEGWKKKKTHELKTKKLLSVSSNRF